MVKVAVLVSGGGTNLQAILDAETAGSLKSGRVTLVVSNNPNAYALTRAANHGVETLVLSKADYPTQPEFETALDAALKAHGIGLIVLAGFMRILSGDFTKKYPERILNVHPALIPSFCGKGFYGLRVHEAALEYGVKVTGATVHFVNEIPDGGRIIAQKAVYIEPDDTPETLQKRVMREAEWVLLPEAIETVSQEILKSV